MTQEIKLDYDAFQSLVSTLRTSTSGIESSVKTSRTFEDTNINPLIKDLEHIIRTLELLKKYQTSLHKDIDVLEQVGEKIKERDLELAEQRNQYAANVYELQS